MRIKALLILISLVVFGVIQVNGQCTKTKKKRIYQMLGAAEYDNHKSTEIIAHHEEKLTAEYQINLFKGVVYKLVFDAYQMPAGVTIKLYDLGKKRGVGKYEKVFDSSTAKKTKNDTYEVTMEFPQRKMLVQYEIEGETKPGCVTFALGYYFKNNIK
jgi:hypothetical protein